MIPLPGASLQPFRRLEPLMKHAFGKHAGAAARRGVGVRIRPVPVPSPSPAPVAPAPAPAPAPVPIPLAVVAIFCHRPGAYTRPLAGLP